MSDSHVTHEQALEVVKAIPAGDTLWRERVALLWRYVCQQEARDRQGAPRCKVCLDGANVHVPAGSTLTCEGCGRIYFIKR